MKKKNSRFGYYILFLCALGVAGCAGDKDWTEAGVESSGQKQEEVPLEHMINAKNYFDYQSGLECSAYASAFVLRHFGEEAQGLELYETFPDKLSDGTGVYPTGITTFFESRGYEAEMICNGTLDDLKKALCKDVPVIVYIHTEEPKESVHYTHYVPVVGYDEEYLYFAESLSYLANCRDEENVPYNRKTEYEQFEKLWSNVDGFYEQPYFVIAKAP